MRPGLSHFYYQHFACCRCLFLYSWGGAGNLFGFPCFRVTSSGVARLLQVCGLGRLVGSRRPA